jgi:hypothetical protein
MASAAELRQRKPAKGDASKAGTPETPEKERPKDEKKAARKAKKSARPRWSCYDALCWLIGNLTMLFCILFVVSKFVPSKKAADFVIEKITGSPPLKIPGTILREEGLRVGFFAVLVMRWM